LFGQIPSPSTFPRNLGPNLRLYLGDDQNNKTCHQQFTLNNNEKKNNDRYRKTAANSPERSIP
jgi:hypothetical protein